jgi:hypothetical protein
MIESLNNSKLSIISYFDRQIKNNKSKKDDLMKSLLLNSNEWELVQALVTPLDAIDAVYKLMSGENYCTISLVYPTVMQFLNDHLLRNESDSQEIIEFKQEFRKEIEYRFFPFDEKIAKTPAILSSVLNPRFKDLSFIQKAIKKLAHSEIKNLMKEIPLNTEGIDESPVEVNEELIIMSANSIPVPSKRIKLTAMEKIFGKANVEPKFSTVAEEFKSYINSTFNVNSNIFNWWQINEKGFPRLSALAKKYLSIPSTSVSSERIFSKAGNLITKKRTALKPDLVNKLVFLNKNYKHLN